MSTPERAYSFEIEPRGHRVAAPKRGRQRGELRLAPLRDRARDVAIRVAGCFPRDGVLGERPRADAARLINECG